MFDVFNAPSVKKGSGASDNTARAQKRHANGETKTLHDQSDASLPDSKRQKRSESEEQSDDGEVDDNEEDREDGEILFEDLAAERARLQAEPAPAMADTFETQQSREFAGSAGLQAKKESEHLQITSQLRHQVALPPNYDYVPLSQHQPPEQPARTFPFQLDPFQEYSIKSIQRSESVLVSAHTSAGKTAVAEYAIAQCFQNNQRVIYTSPIKALSNQKYRDFDAEFGDVGLMTGDITIKPEASCIVMTTEILRSMLYRGSEMMREVGWVVFDEVHYLRDKERGVVWEETIIMLPDKVRYVFLSATIPNAYQFAEWIVKIHNQPCHVVYTDYRPVPLQHYLFPSGGDGIHLVVDEKGTFREQAFGTVMSSLAERQGSNSADPMARRKGRGKDKKLDKGGTKGPSDIFKIMRMIMMKKFNPVIVFSFSKNACESYALQLATLCMNDESEQANFSKVWQGAIGTLSEEDRALPQIAHLEPLLKKGIGVHHGGLLPILKEIIEILFQENLIKVLFATETFSIGLNMPAKTVVFTGVRKFDGHSNRLISASEFIQMSGRAGRRGKDDRGVVMLMIDEKMEPSACKSIIHGEQDKLNSAFHLGYNMILNLLRVEGVSPEFMLERCFYQFQNTASVSGLEKELHAAEQERGNLFVDQEPIVKEYYDIRKQLRHYNQDLHDTMTHPNYCLPYMQVGRLIRVQWQDYNFGWGIVVNFEKLDWKKVPKGAKPQEQWALHVAVNIDAESEPRTKSPNMPVRPPKEGGPSKFVIIPMVLSAVQSIGQIRVFLPEDMSNPNSLNLMKRTLDESIKQMRNKNGPLCFDPVKDMHITDEKFKRTRKKIDALESKLQANALYNSPDLPHLYDQYSQKVEVQSRVKTLKRKITNALSIFQMEELKNRSRVLRRLGFVNDAGVVQMKARVACEISSGDELVLSELLFNGFFNKMNINQCAACLSCFVCDEKTDDPRLREELMTPHIEIKKQARIVAKVSQECKMPVNEDDYVSKFKPQLMEVVYAWTNGASFLDVTKMTEIHEGNLIRLFRRLEELIRQVGEAAQVMGNTDLVEKFNEALTKLRRDIVSVQSLYIE